MDKKAGDMAEPCNGEDGSTLAATRKASAELTGSRELAQRQPQGMTNKQRFLGHMLKWLDLYSRELRLKRKRPG